MPQSPIEKLKLFRDLRDFAVSGELKRGCHAYIQLDEADAAKLQIKAPWRSARKLLKAAIAEAGLQSEYRVAMYPDDDGVWIVKVIRDEAPAGAKQAARRLHVERRQRA